MSTTVAPPTVSVPKRLTTGKYILAVAGLCVVMALLGASAKAIGEQVGGDTGLYVGSAVAFLAGAAVLGLFARTVGNPSTWVICGAMFGMAGQHLGEEIGKPYGWWGHKIGEHGAFILAYGIWVFLVHPRITGRPNQYDFMGVGRGERPA